MKYFQLLILIAFLFPALSCGANTYTAVNCNQSGTNSLGARIAAASDGDTVNGPAGGGSATWSGPVISTHTFSIDGKGCVITVSGADIFHFTWTNSAYIPRITGFTMNGSFGQGGIELDGNIPAFRIDHITVNQSGAQHWLFIGYQSWVTYSTPLYGLVDHITWTGTGSAAAILFYGLNQTWNSPHTMGTAQAIYVEDSTFNGQSGSVTDAQQGAQFVFRHNTVNNVVLGEHDIGAVEARSTRQKEVYNNTFTCSTGTGGGCFDAIFMRGGTGMDFNNAVALDVNGINGFQTAFFTQIFRQNPGGGQIPWLFPIANPDIICAPNGGNGCGGTSTGGICSDFVAHDTTSNHLICYAPSGSCIANPTFAQGAAGQCGKAYYNNSITNTLLTQFDGTGSGGYPARDQTGAGPDTGVNHSQTGGADPEYIWSITEPNNGGVTNYSQVTNANSPYIAANRDYYQQVSSFNGTVGVGVGLLSARPATCTPVVGYWATDTNTLYKCLTTNTWTAAYTPYTYPHPLVISDLSSPAPPRNLTITVN
jgi:hypothetical protein